MKRPDAEVVKALATVVRQHPGLLTWVGDWRKHEQESLPYVVNNMAVAQGRCQVLTELHKLMLDAPDLAAQPVRVAAGNF